MRSGCVGKFYWKIYRQDGGKDGKRDVGEWVSTWATNLSGSGWMCRLMDGKTDKDSE